MPGVPERGALPFDADIVGCRPFRAGRAMAHARQLRPEPDLPLLAMETEALISWSDAGLPGSRLTPRVALLHHTLHEPSSDLLEATDRAARSDACLIQVNRATMCPGGRSRIAGSARETVANIHFPRWSSAMIPHPRRCKRQGRSLLLVGIAMANAARSKLQRECNLRHSAASRPAPGRSIRTCGTTCARPSKSYVLVSRQRP